MKLKSIAQALQLELVGDGEIEISSVSSMQSATGASIVFVEDEKALPEALQSRARAIVSGEFASGAKEKPLLISSQPKLAFARIAALLSPRRASQAFIHPSAVVSSSAKIDMNVEIGPHALIEDEVVIGEGSRIGAGCYLGKGVRLGANSELKPNVTIYARATIGDRCIFHSGVVLGSDGFGYVRDRTTGRYEKFPQVGRLEIGNDVEIGANSTVDRGASDVTVIGDGVKLDNLVHIGHNCQIGENVVIAAQTGLSGSITIEKDVILGGQVGIGEHARIEEGVMLGGQGGVLPNKVLRGKGIAFWGTPAKPVREYLKGLAVLARLAKKE
jgi:UDP-3-O-[3-hydroxymyristoyl] glucosamine N-acyltransferase